MKFQSRNPLNFVDRDKPGILRHLICTSNEFCMSEQIPETYVISVSLAFWLYNLISTFDLAF